MNIPTQSGRGSAACTNYQSLSAARSGKNTFTQTIAQTQSSSLSLTTAEGDLVTLSDLGLSYQQTLGAGWFFPAASGANFSSLSMSGEIGGVSVQGNLNAQELADITKLVGELTSIASSFFSGNPETAMAKAMEFGNLDLGSVSSLSASFSRQTISQTRLAGNTALPAMAEINDLNLKDPTRNLGEKGSGELDYAKLLATRWRQLLKTLEEKKAADLDGLFARNLPLQPAPVLLKAEPPGPAGHRHGSGSKT